MIKCKMKCNGRGYVKVQTYGGLGDLVIETAALVSQIYDGIERQNPEAAKVYKNTLIGMLLDPKSPVFKDCEEE